MLDIAIFHLFTQEVNNGTFKMVLMHSSVQTQQLSCVVNIKVYIGCSCLQSTVYY